MNEKIMLFMERMSQPLTMNSRILVLVAALVLIPTFFTPLWRMTFISQQYPEGLELYIYSHNLVGGNDGNDLAEINVLNHYIGMAELRPQDFSELKWIPLVIGGLLIITLRVVIIGTIKSLLDVIVISLYFGMFSLWSFWYKLNYYGKHLDPRASVNVEPFQPPVFGYKMVGQFDVWSFPTTGSYLFAVFGVCLVAALILSWRRNESGNLKNSI